MATLTKGQAVITEEAGTKGHRSIDRLTIGILVVTKTVRCKAIEASTATEGVIPITVDLTTVMAIPTDTTIPLVILVDMETPTVITVGTAYSITDGPTVVTTEVIKTQRGAS